MARGRVHPGQFTRDLKFKVVYKDGKDKLWRDLWLYCRKLEYFLLFFFFLQGCSLNVKGQVTCALIGCEQFIR